MSGYTRPLEIWVHRVSGDYWLTEQNPCGCHPNDYTVYTPWLQKGFCWIGVSRKKFFILMRERGYERIFKPKVKP